MDHLNVPARAVLSLLVPALLFPSACLPRQGPTLYERSPHVVAVVIAPSPLQSGIKGMAGGKEEGANRGAGSALKDLWSGCGRAAAGASDPLAAAVVTLVCAGITPFVGVGGAVAGAVGSPSADDVDRTRRGLGESLPDRDRAVALFEQKLYAPQEGLAGHAFRSGRDFGLIDRRPEGDYLDLSIQGADAVLEVDRFVIALSGKNLRSELALRACVLVKLTDTLDNIVLYQAERCENGETARSLAAWSADQWAAIRTEMDVALGRLAAHLAWYIFHGNKENAATAPQGEEQMLLKGEAPR